MKKLMAVLGFAIAMSSSNVLALDAAGGSAIIDGFARYQAARVESIILNEFAYSIADDPLMRRFLPSAAAVVPTYKGISGKRLLPIIREEFAADVERIGEVAETIKAFGDDLAEELDAGGTTTDVRKKKLAQAWIAMYLLEQFVSNDGGVQTTKTLLKDLETVLGKKPAASRGVIKSVEQLVDGAGMLARAGQLVPSGEEEGALWSRLFELSSSLASLSHCRAKDKDGKAIVSQKCLDSITTLASRMSNRDAVQLKALLSAVDALRNEFKASSKSAANRRELRYALVAHHLFGVMIALDAQQQTTRFFDFQSGVLFLAEVVDTAQRGGSGDRAEAIEGLIAAFVDEEAAFNMKRLPSTNALDKSGPAWATDSWSFRRCTLILICRNTLFVGSAFGVAYAYLDEDAPGEAEWRARSYGPVGLELKLLSVNDFPITLMYAPIDVGAYITQELKDEEYSAEFEDVVAPSVALSISGRRRPFSLMLGYQDGIRVGEDRDTHAVFAAFVFDLPLLRLF